MDTLRIPISDHPDRSLAWRPQSRSTIGYTILDVLQTQSTVTVFEDLSLCDYDT